MYDGGFGCRIGEAVAANNVRGLGGGVDDGTAMLMFDHYVGNGSADQHHAGQIDSEHFVPPVDGGVRIVLGQDDPGIAVEYMDGAERLHRL